MRACLAMASCFLVGWLPCPAFLSLCFTLIYFASPDAAPRAAAATMMAKKEQKKAQEGATVSVSEQSRTVKPRLRA